MYVLPGRSTFGGSSPQPAFLKSLLISLIIFSSVGSAGNCSIAPLSLPWTNYTLPDGIAVNRGIFVELGGQPASIRCSTTISNTRIRNARDCQLQNATTQSTCQGASGSNFDPLRSKTWRAATPQNWKVTVIDPHRADETVLEGYDVAKFHGGLEISDLPFEVWSNLNSDNKSGLALGPNSSFLEKLVRSEAAPSKVIGLFFGSRSETQGVDGNLTIGGYDQARVSGDWTNFSTQAQYLSVLCPLQVRIKDIRLNNNRGSFSLFADPGSTIAACVDPLQNSFTFTQAIFDRFANLTEHPSNNSVAGGAAFTPQTYPLQAEPLIGNLTIVLSNGYTTIIPHHELVSQERGSDAEGKYSVVNASRLQVALGPGDKNDNGDIVPILGGVYLSQNYLLVDYAKQRFSLAPAVVGRIKDDTHKMITLCEGSPANGSSTVDNNSNKKGQGGTIAGAVVGGVAGIVVVGFLIFLYRKRVRDGTNVESQTRNLEPNPETGCVKPELHGRGSDPKPAVGIPDSRTKASVHEIA